MKALFLDRDGVINKDHDYIFEIKNFEFLPGIFDLCKAAQKHDYKLFIITNQSGIGRGYFSESQYNTLCDWLINKLKTNNIKITKIYSCFSKPDPDENIENGILPTDPNRKPNPGMLFQAIDDFKIDPTQSLMIGDKITDLMAAATANIPIRLLFSEETSSTHPAVSHQIKSLNEAIEFL